MVTYKCMTTCSYMSDIELTPMSKVKSPKSLDDDNLTITIPHSIGKKVTIKINV